MNEFKVFGKIKKSPLQVFWSSLRYACGISLFGNGKTDSVNIQPKYTAKFTFTQAEQNENQKVKKKLEKWSLNFSNCILVTERLSLWADIRITLLFSFVNDKCI